MAVVLAVTAAYLGGRAGLLLWYLALPLAGAGALDTFRLVERPERPRQYDPPGFTKWDRDLGYTLAPERTTHGRRWAVHAASPPELLYDVYYTVDGHGLRVTPRPDDAGHCVLFFGGSFTFGSGVEDEEAFPFQVAAASHGRVATYNLGAPGYGPQQMLAAIEAGHVGRWVKCRPDVAIYLAVGDHVARAAGLRSYSLRSPRYVVRDGRLQRRGLYLHALPSWRRSIWWQQLERRLRNSPILDALVFAPRPPRPEDVELAVAIVREAAARLRASFPGIQLHLLFWDVPGTHDPGYAAALEEAGMRVHRASAALRSLDPAQMVISTYDVHPSPVAHRRLAEYVLDRILGIGPT